MAHLPLKKLMPGRKDARITKANSIKVAATMKYSCPKLVGSGKSAVDEKNFCLLPARSNLEEAVTPVSNRQD